MTRMELGELLVQVGQLLMGADAGQMALGKRALSDAERSRMYRQRRKAAVTGVTKIVTKRDGDQNPLPHTPSPKLVLVEGSKYVEEKKESKDKILASTAGAREERHDDRHERHVTRDVTVAAAQPPPPAPPSEERVKPTGRKKTKTQVPEDWQPSAEQVAKLSAKYGFDPKPLVAKFVGHHRAKGTTFARHDLAFDNWCANEHEWSRGKRPGRIVQRLTGTEGDWSRAF